ncbi:aminodeoxychorismate/anthranilate synthase component II [Arthrobacter zhangbolii]|uniref:Aminodeoxychorismate/anthranilate synthase component II n=1 Tax=Arthrobacter zhangbolii TaxID=2886936 RepID=A0A9X1M6N7_9MICC|nr:MULTISPECIES: aminodeoxychorismate/anthranilate synthase component II [Arthrobacter]MCC3272011.1 aminodeoxychorismate/anthranilate synthase component II [Arthrobacter zhangbolii]MCC3294507.1 aminodeoxychorismate/anthranilate synthase component II [Arthrobacter zhangbolii]MDN3903070.1 aminodeoxychorismate/anthranilate synthase component II [Arthrobacter sp. YD2]UON92109.1 aminodeoxychorismate/anthranilate synthase component II [Arthrobacter zhangbolii]
MSTRILVIDNYDSFVYTLVGYLQELGADTTVVRNDDLSIGDAVKLAAEHDGVLVSPGPGTPAEAGVSVELIRWCGDTGTPMLGICLGHQALAEAYGGTVTHAPELMHGKTSRVEHGGRDVFAGLPSPLTATRYHSLAAVADSIPADLEVTARTASGIIMGLRHAAAPLSGVQFHPESVLTEGGYQMLGNWLESAGLSGAAAHAATLSPLISTTAASA